MPPIQISGGQHWAADLAAVLRSALHAVNEARLGGHADVHPEVVKNLLRAYEEERPSHRMTPLSRCAYGSPRRVWVAPMPSSAWARGHRCFAVLEEVCSVCLLCRDDHYVGVSPKHVDGLEVTSARPIMRRKA